jgi:hypothetical protein
VGVGQPFLPEDYSLRKRPRLQRGRSGTRQGQFRDDWPGTGARRRQVWCVGQLCQSLAGREVVFYRIGGFSFLVSASCRAEDIPVSRFWIAA